MENVGLHTVTQWQCIINNEFAGGADTAPCSMSMADSSVNRSPRAEGEASFHLPTSAEHSTVSHTRTLRGDNTITVGQLLDDNGEDDDSIISADSGVRVEGHPLEVCRGFRFLHFADEASDEEVPLTWTVDPRVLVTVPDLKTDN
jgi:hypothetical protein